ncbi:MAG TPA: transposase [Bacteroidia bacterium]|nr:transposase [Bacteroidia bacterium]
MNDNPLHNRHSIRLKGYDYSKAGAYFITICVKDKIHFFGKIENGEMILNDAGIMIDKWWQKIPEKFPDIELCDYQIMPNHFHAIIINTGIVRADPVGADPRVRPETESSDSNESLEINIGQTHGSAPTDADMDSPLYAVVQWFKTMSTNEYIHGVKKLGWRPFYGKLWQRNYYEHIIRDEKSYNAIADYINNNPANLANDNLYLK